MLHRKILLIACKSSGRTWWPLHTPLRSYVQVDRSDELEHRVVLYCAGLLRHELIPVQKLGQEDLDFLESEVEANAHSLASGEGNVCRLVSVLDALGVPTVRIEAVGVVP